MSDKENEVLEVRHKAIRSQTRTTEINRNKNIPDKLRLKRNQTAGNSSNKLTIRNITNNTQRSSRTREPKKSSRQRNEEETTVAREKKSLKLCEENMSNMAIKNINCTRCCAEVKFPEKIPSKSFPELQPERSTKRVKTDGPQLMKWTFKKATDVHQTFRKASKAEEVKNPRKNSEFQQMVRTETVQPVIKKVITINEYRARMNEKTMKSTPFPKLGTPSDPRIDPLTSRPRSLMRSLQKNGKEPLCLPLPKWATFSEESVAREQKSLKFCGENKKNITIRKNKRKHCCTEIKFPENIPHESFAELQPERSAKRVKKDGPELMKWTLKKTTDVRQPIAKASKAEEANNLRNKSEFQKTVKTEPVQPVIKKRINIYEYRARMRERAMKS